MPCKKPREPTVNTFFFETNEKIIENKDTGSSLVKYLKDRFPNRRIL